MLNALRTALRHYRELILAGTFAVMAAWEVLEILLLEPAYRGSIRLTLVIHSLQVLLIVAATGIALRAWREKTARQRALASLVEQVIAAQEDERRRVAYDVHDGVAQLVVSAKQHLDTATDLWPRDAQRAASETAIAADRLGRAIAETRRILAALRPVAVDAGASTPAPPGSKSSSHGKPTASISTCATTAWASRPPAAYGAWGCPACGSARAFSAAPASSRRRPEAERTSTPSCRCAMASSLPHPDPTRVLLVDDHPMVREGLRGMLEAADVEVVAEAGTGEEALRAAAAHAPDVVLLDLELPDLDGLTVLRRLKAIEKRLAVLVVTMHDDPALVRQAVESGASGYVLKGISRRELLAALEVVRHGGSVLDPSLLRATLADGASESRPASRGDRDNPLSSIEQEMLRLVAQGLTNREIGVRLRWSVGTVKKYLQRALEKLGASDRTHEAIRRGLLS